jgi:FMN phosphatase YigB (HAD superfamily)
MNLKAVIFDLYGTALRVAPGPRDADSRWDRCLEAWRSDGLRWTGGLPEFAARSSEIVQEILAKKRLEGIDFPEVDWLEIIAQVVRLRGDCGGRALARRIAFAHARLVRSCTLAPGAAAVFEHLHSSGVLLGLCTNSQSYTGMEWRAALRRERLPARMFVRDLQFWSYRFGFSKPSPQVFACLAGRMQRRGILTNEALMVGDNAENDIAPAQQAGMRTWRLGPHGDGGWHDLLAFLRGQELPAPPQAAPS